VKINLRIEFNSGETKEIVCQAADLVKFESKFDLSVANLEKNLKFTHLCFLAWASETRTKASALDFDSWMETIMSVGVSEKDPK
jgi:hypothetical protein